MISQEEAIRRVKIKRNIRMLSGIRPFEGLRYMSTEKLIELQKVFLKLN